MNRKVMIDWKGLKELGWPYSRAQTHRLMQPEIELSRTDRKTRAREYWKIPNPDRFPQSYSMGQFKVSRKVWKLDEVLAYFERHGITTD